MTDHDKEKLSQMAKDLLAWEFPHPLNTPEAGKVLHDVSALLIKIANHIKSKIQEHEQSTQGEVVQDTSSTDRNG